MKSEGEVLVGILALKLDLISSQQFADAHRIWLRRAGVSLGTVLVESGAVSAQDLADLERLAARQAERRRANEGDRTSGSGVTPKLSDGDRSLLQSTLMAEFSGPPPLDATCDEAAPQRDRYTLNRLHARGGIGQVWLAYDRVLQREVALKELRPERSADAGFAARFVREAIVTGKLNHPGIVPIYDVVAPSAPNSAYYTMRFVGGGTLGDAIERYHVQLAAGNAGALELRGLIDALVGVCLTTAYAHSHGFLHRDIKPQNVALGEFGEVILLDWGLARQVNGAPDADGKPSGAATADVDADSTRAGSALGTPGYMSPEQAAGRHDAVGFATDVFGLGAILYKILTNRAPFAAASTDQAIKLTLETEPTPPRRVVRGVPRALDAVCLKALAKDPAARYESPTALAGDLKHWLAGEPTLAHPESLGERFGRWSRRHWKFATATVAALVVAVVALTVVNATIQKEKQATRRGLERTLTLVEDVFRVVKEHVPDIPETRRSKFEFTMAGLDAVALIREEVGGDEALAAKLAAIQKLVPGTWPKKAKLDIDERHTENVRKAAEAYSADRNAKNLIAYANAQHAYGVELKHAGRRNEAVARLQLAFDLLQKITGKNRTLRFALAKALNELSSAKFEYATAEEAEHAAERAANAFRETPLAGETPNAEEAAYLVGCLVRLGNCRRLQGKHSDALDDYAEALQVAGDATQRLGKTQLLEVFRGAALLARARTCAETKDRSRAEKAAAFDECIGVLLEAAQKYQGVDRFTLPLADAYCRRGEWRLTENDAAGAAADVSECRRALETLPSAVAETVLFRRIAATAEVQAMRIAVRSGDRVRAEVALNAAKEHYFRLLHDFDPENREIAAERAAAVRLAADSTIEE